MNQNLALDRKFTWSWTQIRILLAETYKEWSAAEAPRMGASLAYYTMLSLAPLLIVVIAIAGFAFGEQAARGALVSQIQGLVGADGAKAIQGIIQEAASKKSTGLIASILGFGALLFGASSVALELRSTMNKIWKTKDQEGIGGMIKDRSYALAIVLSAGFLLLVSLVVSAALASVDKFFGSIFPVPAWTFEFVNAVVSLLVITGIIAVIFKMLPSVPIAWRDVMIGAAFTSILFTLGKTLIGLYLGRAGVGSSYGAAGSLVVVLVWIYYSAQIFFFGAEFTRVYAIVHGTRNDLRAEIPVAPFADAATDAANLHGESRVPEIIQSRPFAIHVAILAGALVGFGAAVVGVFRSENPKKTGGDRQAGPRV